jgi:hypothetical protein
MIQMPLMSLIGPRFISALSDLSDDLSQIVAYPAGFQVGEEFSVIRCAADMLCLARMKRWQMTGAGISALSGRVAAFELPRKGRYRLWMDIDHLGRQPVRSAEQAILYCGDHGGQPRIELMHFLHPCSQQAQMFDYLRKAG